MDEKKRLVDQAILFDITDVSCFSEVTFVQIVHI